MTSTPQPTPAADSMLEKVRDFQKIMTDFPRGWDVCINAAQRASHHERCSWRTSSMLCDCAAESTFIYCIDNYVKPFQEIATSYEKLHAENQVMREAFQWLSVNGNPNSKQLLVIRQALSKLSSPKSE